MSHITLFEPNNYGNLHEVWAFAEALVLGTFPFSNLNKVVALAAHHKIPAMYPNRSLAVAGGLMSYEAPIGGISYQVGLHYVGRIQKARSRPTYPPSCRLNLSWFSTSRPRRRSA